MKSPAKKKIKLATELDSLAAAQLVAELRSTHGHPVIIDASDVAYAGALAAQSLVVAARQWAKDENEFSLHPISEGLGRSFNDLGIGLEEFNAAASEGGHP